MANPAESHIIDRSEYGRSRWAYIFECLFEYLISLMIVDAFLATLLKEAGISDALTGILSSIVSLACGVQFFSVMLIHPKKSVKPWIITLHIVNQVSFALMYFIPFLRVPQGVKTVLFVIFLLGGYCISNIVAPFKTNWCMGLVESDKRSSFNATKEMISLVGGMTFTYAMGSLMDYLKRDGSSERALVMTGGVIFALMLCHTVCLILTKDPFHYDDHSAKRETFAVGLKRSMKVTFGNPVFRRVFPVRLLYYTANYLALPYFGVYQIQELGFSLTFVSILAILSSVARICVSRMFGRFGDKHSYVAMLQLSFILFSVALTVNAFSNPATGFITYPIYMVVHGIACAGIANGILNLAFAYAEPENRTVWIGVEAAVAGVCGFFATLVGGWILSAVQNNGNRIFGVPVYGQQVLCVISAIILFLAVLYTGYVRKHVKRVG